VIPDLAERRVARELWTWAWQRKAPDEVIKALYSAASGSPRQMDRIIGPALAARWRAEHGMAEHGINVPQAPRHASRLPPATGPGSTGSVAASGERRSSHDDQVPVTPPDQVARADLARRLLNLLDRSVPVPVPLILAVLIAMIVLVVAIR
jgi:hypothetical protein